MELNRLTIHELHDKIKSGEVAARQITESVLARINAVEKRVHAYIPRCPRKRWRRQTVPMQTLNREISNP